VLITHAHPDHVAGLTEWVGTADVPIMALPAVDALMRASEEPKRAQWQPVYKEEWNDHWTFPTRLVQDGRAITFDGVTYRVHDVGPGGDCDANSLWVIEPEPRAAFVGDLVFNGLHAYMADDHVLAWLANLERARTLLSQVEILYPGHGALGALDLLEAQRAYLLAYCGAVKELACRQPTLSEEAKGHLTACMQRLRPGAGLTFLIAHSADAVAAELAGRH
jgi:glyoxylase-like metal-dependent hydrolase (beta-lactamase superfamily II)